MKMIDAINNIKQHGYVILESVLSEQACKLYKSLLNRDYKKYASKHAGSNATDHGLNIKDREKVVYNLHNKDIRYFDLCDHPKVFPIIKKLLQEGSYQNSEPINLLSFDARNPNRRGDAQQLHMDSNLPGQGRYPLIMVALFMLEDFTVENGATRFVPDSHLRSDYAENNKIYDEEVSAVAKKGSVLIFNGALWHGGGRKYNDTSRWSIVPSYGRWFIKPSFNFVENIPSHIFEQLTDERKALLGLNTCPPKDEFTRITRKSTEYEWKFDYKLPC